MGGAPRPHPHILVIPSALFLARGICFSARPKTESRFVAPLRNEKSHLAREMNNAAGGFTPYIAAKLF
jgi:hypothetical protein